MLRLLFFFLLLLCGEAKFIFSSSAEEDQQRVEKQQQQEEDLYTLLDIEPHASERQVKQAFRRLSVKHHPDKGGSPEKFNQISLAYEILVDPEKRSLYDAGGMDLVEQAGKVDAFGRPRVRKGPSVEVDVPVHLKDVYVGGHIKTNLRRRVVCRGCRGREGEALPRCSGCTASCPNEVKVTQRRVGPMVMNEEVSVPSHDLCKQEISELDAVIERGASEGSRITFARASEQSPGTVPGDVHLVLKTKPHTVFRRDGDDLEMTLRITLRQALLGFERVIRHLDGHPVRLKGAGVVSPGQVILVPNEGMPRHGVPSEFGSLRVTVSIVFPSNLSSAESAFVSSHFEQFRVV